MRYHILVQSLWIFGASQLLTSTQHHFSFAETLLAGQVATLAWYTLQAGEAKKRAPRVAEPAEPVRIGQLIISGHLAGTEKFHEALKQCIDDAQMKGIILKIDADWGNIGICTALFHELKRAKQYKPIVALIEKSCCREPYLVAAAADCIIANEQAVVGMIGTIAYYATNRPDPNKDASYFYTGKFMPLGDNLHQLTPHDQELIVRQLELRYEQLCATIAAERGLALDEKELWAEGNPFLGKQALALKLIDQIGTLSDAFDFFTGRLCTRNISNPASYELVPFHIS